jgi:hypothetical protein
MAHALFFTQFNPNLVCRNQECPYADIKQADILVVLTLYQPALRLPQGFQRNSFAAGAKQIEFSK